MNKRLNIDLDNDEFIVNGNRLSQNSLLNLLSLILFMNLRHLAIKYEEVRDESDFLVMVGVDQFEEILAAVETHSVSVVFSYSEEMDTYIISVGQRVDYKEGDNNDESLHDREE